MLMNTVMHMTCSLEVKIQMTIDWMILSPFLRQKQLCVLQYFKVIKEMVMSDRAGRRNDVQEFIIYIYIYIYIYISRRWL